MLCGLEFTALSGNRAKVLKGDAANPWVCGHAKNPLEQRARRHEVSLALIHRGLRVQRLGVRVGEAMPNSHRSAFPCSGERLVPLTACAKHARPAAPRGSDRQRIVAARGRLVMRERAVEHAEFLETESFFDVAEWVRHVGC